MGLIFNFFQSISGDLLFLICVFLVATYRHNKAWMKKVFQESVLFTMTGIVEGRLKIRAMGKYSHSVLFENKKAIKTVLRAAKLTTLSQPLLMLPDDLNTETILTDCLIAVSSMFPTGNAAYTAGMPTVSIPCWICLSSEVEAPEHTERVRVEIVPQALLKEVKEMKEPLYDFPSHQVRWRTLLAMLQALEQNPHLLMEVMIHLPNPERRA